MRRAQIHAENETAPRGRAWRAVQALQLSWQGSPVMATLLIVLTLTSVVLPLVVAYLGKASVDAVVAHAGARAVRLVWWELLLVLVMGAAQRTNGLLRALLGARLALQITLQILAKALRLELRHFQDPEFYDKLSRARRESTARPLALASELLSLLQSVLSLLGFAGLIFSFSSLAVVVLIVAALPAAAAEVRFSKAAFELRQVRAAAGRRLGYLEYVLSSDEHAKEVMTLDLGPVLLERYRGLGESICREDGALQIRRTIWSTLLAQLGPLSFYGCYLFIVGLAASGRITLGQMTLYVIAFRQGQQAFLASLMSLGALYEHDLYLANLLDFLATPTQQRLLPMTAPVAAADTKTAVAPTERGIRFEGVGFRYPGQERFVLRNLDLFIPAGRSLALVGANGAGKTTFIKLLTGLYEPTEGRVLIDGVDLRSVPIPVLRQRIAVVFQDYNQYQFSVRENVGYGSPQHVTDNSRIARAVQRGGADEFVAALPEGIETQLGRWFDKGVELSGGQWQRIALSRAFMREQADILILDEPTAALDALAEQQVFERFRRLAQGRTVLLIAHRFPTVRMADHIVVLDDSRILEQGTHDELLRASGRYAAMFQVQARGYL